MNFDVVAEFLKNVRESSADSIHLLTPDRDVVRRVAGTETQ